jgi:hypothetical protein
MMEWGMLAKILFYSLTSHEIRSYEKQSKLWVVTNLFDKFKGRSLNWMVQHVLVLRLIFSVHVTKNSSFHLRKNFLYVHSMYNEKGEL